MATTGRKISFLDKHGTYACHIGTRKINSRLLKQWHTQALKPLTPKVDCFFQTPQQKADLYITRVRDRKMQVNPLQWIWGITFYMEGNQRGKRGEQKTLTRYGDKSTEHLFCSTPAFISIGQLNWQKKKVIHKKNIEIITSSKLENLLHTYLSSTYHIPPAFSS